MSHGQPEAMFPYPDGGHRPQLWFGMAMIGFSLLFLLPEVDFIGVPLPLAAQVGGALFSVSLGVWLAVKAVARGRSDAPAVAVRGQHLFIHVHPGRPRTLTASDIVDVGPVREVSRIGRRLAYGRLAFRIATTASGGRAMTLEVGERSVAAPLEDVRSVIMKFAQK